MKELAKEVALINAEDQKTVKTEPEVYYKVSEVATMLKKSEETIRLHLRIGILKAGKTGKAWSISQTNLNQYISNERE